MKFDLLNLLPFWRAIRHYSLTASVVFASAILGFSVVKLLRRLLHELSVPWLFLWLIPIFLIGAVAKRESNWVPDANFRRKLALGIALGSIVLAVVIGRIRREIAATKEPAAEQIAPENTPSEPLPDRTAPPRHHRPKPRGK